MLSVLCRMTAHTIRSRVLACTVRHELYARGVNGGLELSLRMRFLAIANVQMLRFCNALLLVVTPLAQSLVFGQKQLDPNVGVSALAFEDPEMPVLTD